MDLLDVHVDADNELARRFHRAPRDDAQEVLNALVALGLARRLDDNRYAP